MPLVCYDCEQRLTKHLAVIDINNVKDVPDPEQDAWNSLVLPEGHKHMVHSVVQAHFRDKKNVRSEDEIQTDLIRGKGE
jgi:hypothetical protein